MKKYVTLGIVAILFVFMLTGCGEKYSYEKTEFETIVIQCEKGEFHPDESYLTTADIYLAHGNYTLWSMYTDWANANGTYDYNVTINIDENNYTVIREDQYEIGQSITIIKINTYNMDSQLINTEYK